MCMLQNPLVYNWFKKSGNDVMPDYNFSFNNKTWTDFNLYPFLRWVTVLELIYSVSGITMAIAPHMIIHQKYIICPLVIFNQWQVLKLVIIFFSEKKMDHKLKTGCKVWLHCHICDVSRHMVMWVSRFWRVLIVQISERRDNTR